MAYTGENDGEAEIDRVSLWKQSFGRTVVQIASSKVLFTCDWIKERNATIFLWLSEQHGEKVEGGSPERGKYQQEWAD